MSRHDSNEQRGEPAPPGTPNAQALGAMAAAVQRARQAQEGGPPTQAVQIPFDDVEGPVPSPAAAPSPRTGRRARSPLEIAVFAVAALVLVAAGALAVTLGTGGAGPGPGAPEPLAVQPHPAHHARSGAHHGVATAPATTDTPTTTLPVATGGPPVIAGLEPSSGTAGEAIVVAGTNFMSATGQIVATFNGQVAPTRCPAQNTCSVTVPPLSSGAHTAQVVITTAGGISNTVTFTYS